MKNILDILIDDFHERALPELMPRRQSMARVSHKANVVIGMRRSGKTWFCISRCRSRRLVGNVHCSRPCLS